MELWELVARERVRDSLARYTWAGDSLKVEEMVLAFCEDGLLELRGEPPIAGRAAIAAFISGVGAAPVPSGEAALARRIVRHSVTNVRFVHLTRAEARVESYFTVVTDIGLDHVGRYRDVLVPVGDEWLIRQRRVSTDWRSLDSTMAPPSALR